MKIAMTIDEALELAHEWSRGCTFYEGSQGWRVVCLLLAEEVQKLRSVNEWREAVLDELASTCIDYPVGTPPRDILKGLIAVRVSFASGPISVYDPDGIVKKAEE